MSSPNSRELVERYRDGDSQAAGKVYDRYLARLLGLVRQKISPKLRQRIDAEDVVQSAYRSFFVHAKDDEYVLEHAGDLWRLLAGIAIHKLHAQIERHTAAKRDIGREHGGELDDSAVAASLEDAKPTADEAVALVEQVSLLLGRMSPIVRQVMELRLCGESVEAIAEAVGRAPRTVRRLVDNARREMKSVLMGEGVVTWNVAPIRWPVDPRATLSYADFSLEKLVGAGGTGKVYRATQRSLDRAVAIKALHKKWQRDRALVETFVHEALVLSRLDHPHIVKLYGLGQFPGGGYFLAMEYFAGKSLQALIEDQSLATERIYDVFRQVVAAVAYVHEHGIVHCDIKPANVLFDHEGRAAVSDFGFAQLATSKAGNSVKRTLAGGTKRYIAPELLADKHAKIEPTADIYSLGALLRAMIACRPATAADGAEWPQLASSDAGSLLAAIGAKCLAKRPQARYPSAAAILCELERVRRGNSTIA